MSILLVFALTPDDVFVTLRYAANFVHGDGLAFNPGQHVQGFTSPLDLFVAVVVYLIPGGFALLKMKLASVLFGLLAIREGAALLEHVNVPTWARRVGMLTVALSPVIAFASTNGLETSLEMWLLIAVVRRLYNMEGLQSDMAVGVFAFAAVLARPDALAPLACMAIVGLVIERATPWYRRITWFLGAIGAGLATTVVEVTYFGSWLPNTYFAKEISLSRSVDLGYRYLNSLLQPVGFDPLLRYPRAVHMVFFIEAILVLAGLYTVARFARRGAYLVAAVIGQALFVLKAGGDYMVGGRFLAGAAIPFIVLEVIGVVKIGSSLNQRLSARVRRTPMMLGSCLLVATSVVPLAYVNAPAWNVKGLTNAPLLSSYLGGTLSDLWVDLPSLLRCVPPGSLVATTEVGYIGFSRQDLRILDLRGLTDREVAKSAPADIKETWGVQDYNWYLPKSPVGRILMRAEPDVIVEFDTTPSGRVLADHYKLWRLVSLTNIKVGFYIPVAAKSMCGSPEG